MSRFSFPGPEAAQPTLVKHYRRLGTVPLEAVLGAIRTGLAQAMIFGESVSLTGLRLATFAQADRPRCSNTDCQLEASFFAVEQQAKNAQAVGFHLNLYGVNAHGQEVLFTHDHTLARSLGGQDTLENTSCMCLPCNARKSVQEHKQVQALRRSQGLPAHYSARGPEPTAKTAPLGPSGLTVSEEARAHAQLAWSAAGAGMDLEAYRAWCETQARAQPQPALPPAKRREQYQRRADLLGLSLGAYRFMRYHHDQQQLAVRQPRRAGPRR